MPLSIEDFREPKFIRWQEKKPFGENVKDKFYATSDRPRSYRSEDGAFPQPGYNPNANQVTPRKVNINTDNLTLPPY